MTDERRKPGRPALGPAAKSVSIGVRVSPSRADELYERAQKEGTTVPDLIRKALDPAKR